MRAAVQRMPHASHITSASEKCPKELRIQRRLRGPRRTSNHASKTKQNKAKQSSTQTPTTTGSRKASRRFLERCTKWPPARSCKCSSSHDAFPRCPSPDPGFGLEGHVVGPRLLTITIIVTILIITILQNKLFVY